MKTIGGEPPSIIGSIAVNTKFLLPIIMDIHGSDTSHPFMRVIELI